MRGRGRGFQRDHSQSYGRDRNTQEGNPLMSAHLRELDIELEILKKKRDMIQQEQELLDRERQFNLKRQYLQESSNSYSQSSSRSGYSSNYYRQQGNKRQAVGMSPPRRFDTPPRIEPWEHNTAQSSKPKNYNYNPNAPKPLLSVKTDIRKPLLQNPIPQIRKTFRPPPKQNLPTRKDFNPTKVTKPKLRTTFREKPQKEEPVKTAKEDSQILQRNVKPSGQLNGRLELALGSILKNIKEIEPVVANPSTSFLILREIKQIIRVRIRNVMMDQTVGLVPDIVASYRNKYPIETDVQLAQLAKKAQRYSLPHLYDKSNPDSEDPKLYFQGHFTQLLSKTLDEVFGHVKNMYAEKNNDDVILKIMDNVVDISYDKIDTTDSTNIDEGKEDNKDTSELEKKIAKAKVYSDLMEALLEKHLPKYLIKCKQIIISMLKENKEHHNSKCKIQDEAIKMALKLVTKKFKEDQFAGKSLDNENNVTEGEFSEEIEISTDKQTETNENNSENTGLKPSEANTENDAHDAINSADMPAASDSADSPAKKSPQTPITTSSSLKIIDFPYSVKLVGRPGLPSRQAVYEFLDQYKPASIKKHKTVGNLLVLGFNDKEGYEKILEANETTIGTNTIIIKASDKVNTTPIEATSTKKHLTNVNKTDQTNDESDSNKTGLKLQMALDTKNENGSANSSFSVDSELDNQISNLLTSIREAEEAYTPETEAVKSDRTESTTKEDMAIESQNIVENDNISKVVGKTPEKNYAKDANSTTAVKNTDILNNDVAMETITEDDENKSVEMNKDVDNANKNTVNVADNNKNNAEQINNTSDITKVSLKKGDTMIDKDKNNGNDASKEDSKRGKSEEKDSTSGLKESGRATPTRSSARLATGTPSSIKTRRASRLLQNN